MSNVQSNNEFIDNSDVVPIATAAASQDDDDDDDVEAHEEEVNKNDEDNVEEENKKSSPEQLRHQPNTIRKNIFHDQQDENVRNVRIQVQHA